MLSFNYNLIWTRYSSGEKYYILENSTLALTTENKQITYNFQTDYMHIIDTQVNVGLCSFPHSDIGLAEEQKCKYKNTSSLWQTVKWILTDQSSHDALWQQQTTQEDSKTTMWHHRKHQVAITAHDHRGSCQRTCGDTRKQTYSSYSQTHI